MITLAIQGETPEEIDAWCIRRLLQRSYIVEKHGPWETQTQVCKRLQISPSKFRRRWRRYPRPKVNDVQLGPKGRLILIRSNPVLDLFLKHR